MIVEVSCRTCFTMEAMPPVGNVAPQPGDTLVFPAGAAQLADRDLRERDLEVEVARPPGASAGATSAPRASLFRSRGWSLK